MNRTRRTKDRGPSFRRPSRRDLLARSDEQLVDLVLDGHDAAFEVLFERHVADSLWYAREVLGSWGEAEEAVRHSFAAAHAYLETRGRETEFLPWLHTILGNHCLSMLQARTPGPEQRADSGKVVDLGEWRLRRKLFGAALPLAPSAALRDSVMAACGIGTGVATTTGAPLLGGMLAKLAVVAVLAGGAGVAGDVESDRATPIGADTGTQVSVERTVDTAGGSRTDLDPAHESPGRLRGSTRQTAWQPDGASRSAPKRDFRRHNAPAKRRSIQSAPSTGDGPTDVTRPVSAVAATGAASVAVVPPVQSTLRRAIDVVKARLPAAGNLSTTRIPNSVALSKISDDLGVTAVESPVDVHALLSQGTDVLPK